MAAMRPAQTLATFTLLAAPSVAQATIERVVHVHGEAEDAESLASARVVGGGVNDRMFDSSGTFCSASVSLSVWDDPGLAGVALARIGFTLELSAELSYTLLATDPDGTQFSVVSTGEFAETGFGTNWGSWSEPENLYMFSGASPSPMPPGSSQQHTVSGLAPSAYPRSMSADPSVPWWYWQNMLAMPVLYPGVYFDNPLIDVLKADGATPTTAVVTSASARAFCALTIEQTVELTEVQTIPTCTSLPNSTGQHGSLRAFGSLVGGTDWLTVRSSNLPAGEFSLLFMGTQPDFQPAATYNLCVGGSLTREGGVQEINANGEADHEIDLTPQMPGTVLYAQVVHRDPALQIAATDAVAFVVE